MAEVLVIGGGVAGMEAALTLVRKGIKSIIVEKGSTLGGQAARYNCKSLDGVCQACGACLALQKSREVAGEEMIQVFLSTTVIEVKQVPTGYAVVLSTGGVNSRVEVRGIIVAAGLSTFPSEARGEFGYLRLPGVVTALDLEAILRECPEALGVSPHVAFIQCLGSREAGSSAAYCSRVCCLYVPKLAGLVSSRFPGTKPDIFYMDRQGYESIYQHRPSLDNYIRAIPGKIFPLPHGRLKVVYYDSVSGRTGEKEYDWVILCPAVRPGDDVALLASILGTDTGEDGFINVIDGVITNREGILAAGACTAPMSIIESITSGQAAAGEMCRYLKA